MLQERTPDVNISHRKMPSWEQHIDYVKRGDHKHWYLIETRPGGIVGQVYLSDRDEIGIQIFWQHQRRGYGTAALQAFFDIIGPGEYLANVNPRNKKSQNLWHSLGFELIQYTYRGTIKS